jgi:hypothetical protein
MGKHQDERLIVESLFLGFIHHDVAEIAYRRGVVRFIAPTRPTDALAFGG